VTGSLSVILGSMYSGKSTRLLELVRRADLGRRQFALVKPKVDNRFSSTDVVSHDGSSYPCHVVEASLQILEILPRNVELLFIDEAQFFDDNLLQVVEQLALEGVRVVVAGLDLDFQGHPFPSMVALAFSAEELTKLTAICDLCGENASRSQRVVDGKPVTHGALIQVGGVESYEPRCRSCFESPHSVYSREEIDQAFATPALPEVTA